jgi:hypothetical protein
MNNKQIYQQGSVVSPVDAKYVLILRFEKNVITVLTFKNRASYM